MRLATVVFLALTAAANAQTAPAEVSAFDVAIDPQSYNKKTITVTGCRLFNAVLATVNCGVISPNGDQIGNLLLDGKSMDKASRREVLTRCAGDDIKSECVATVTGRAELVLGEYIRIRKAKIVFDNDSATQ